MENNIKNNIFISALLKAKRSTENIKTAGGVALK